LRCSAVSPLSLHDALPILGSAPSAKRALTKVSVFRRRQRLPGKASVSQNSAHDLGASSIRSALYVKTVPAYSEAIPHSVMVSGRDRKSTRLNSSHVSISYA